MKICVFGASSAALDNIYYEETEKLGMEMAKHGHTLIFGGGDKGVMGSVARGMKKEKGQIISIVPEFFDLPGILYENVTETIFTKTMAERKTLMEDISDAFIVAPGGTGTFEEFFEAFTLKQLGQVTKPIAIFNVNEYFNPLIELMNHAMREHFLKPECADIYEVFTNIDEMLHYIETLKEEPRDLRKLKY